CAFWIGSVYAGTFHGEFTGYDPSYADYSPGMFLTLRIIEGLCSKDSGESVTEIDFGLGDAQYKQVLGNRQWLDATVYLFAPTFRGMGLNLLRTPLLVIDETSRRVLDQAKILSRTKTVWRNMIRKKHPLTEGEESRRRIPK